jgi:hypothetical protein
MVEDFREDFRGRDRQADASWTDAGGDDDNVYDSPGSDPTWIKP